MKYRQWISLVVLAVCLYVFWQIRNILLLTFAAVVFAIVLNRAVRLIQRWVPSRKAAVLIVVVSGFLVIGGLGIVIVPPFGRQTRELIELSPQIIDRFQTWLQNRDFANAEISRDFQIVESLSNQLSNFDVRMLINSVFQYPISNVELFVCNGRDPDAAAEPSALSSAV